MAYSPRHLRSKDRETRQKMKITSRNLDRPIKLHSDAGSDMLHAPKKEKIKIIMGIHSLPRNVSLCIPQGVELISFKQQKNKQRISTNVGVVCFKMQSDR